MTTRRQKIQQEASAIAAPVLKELGLGMVDVEFSSRGSDQVLCLYLDRQGGVSLDELQDASRSIEKVIEVSEIIQGRFRLEVSSPGIDRPWKRPEDYRKNIGAKVKIKLFSALPDGRRTLRGVLTSVENETITLELDGEQPLTVDLKEVTSARPEIDWDDLLKKTGRSERKAAPSRRSP